MLIRASYTKITNRVFLEVLAHFYLIARKTWIFSEFFHTMCKTAIIFIITIMINLISFTQFCLLLFFYFRKKNSFSFWVLYLLCCIFRFIFGPFFSISGYEGNLSRYILNKLNSSSGIVSSSIEWSEKLSSINSFFEAEFNFRIFE